MGNKHKNVNLNNSNNNTDNKTNLDITTRVPVIFTGGNKNNIRDDGDDDLMHTQSETSLTASSSASMGDDSNLEQPVVQRSSSSDNVRTTNEKQKPSLRDSAEGLDHKHFLVRGLCLGSYPLFHKGKK